MAFIFAKFRNRGTPPNFEDPPRNADRDALDEPVTRGSIYGQGQFAQILLGPASYLQLNPATGEFERKETEQWVFTVQSVEGGRNNRVNTRTMRGLDGTDKRLNGLGDHSLSIEVRLQDPAAPRQYPEQLVTEFRRQVLEGAGVRGPLPVAGRAFRIRGISHIVITDWDLVAQESDTNGQRVNISALSDDPDRIPPVEITESQ